MKYIKLTLFIVIIFGACVQNIHATSAKLIMVPEYIGGYKTTELLEYIAEKKKQEEVVVPKPVIKTPSKGKPQPPFSA